MTKRYLPDTYRFGPNFTVHGLTRSETAERNGIDVRVEKGSTVANNLRMLVANVLQPTRDRIGEPVYVTSGYRPERVNELVGGVADSQHVEGEAADVYAVNYSIARLATEIVESAIDFDQLIVEHDKGVVHASHSIGRNRRAVLTRYDTGDGLRYLDGVWDEEDLEDDPRNPDDDAPA